MGKDGTQIIGECVYDQYFTIGYDGSTTTSTSNSFTITVQDIGDQDPVVGNI